jgi:Protein of unknown function (DUF3631)
MTTTYTPAADKAQALLVGLLAHGAHPTTELHQLARAAGISPTTLRRTAEALGVEVHQVPRVGFGPAPEASWALPEAPDPVQVPALLADLLAAFRGLQRLHTWALLATLRAKEPWATLWADLDWRQTARRLALALAPHGVRPARVKVHRQPAQGYRRADVLQAIQMSARRTAA